MLVKKRDFQSVISELKKERVLSLDTETTGLFPYQGDRLFSIIIGTEHESFYFNFQDYDGVEPEQRLSHHVIAPALSDLFSNPKTLVFLANAKFDMHMLSVEGVEIKAKIWDVLTIAKTLDNTHLKYSLEAVAERAGYEKSGAVDEYIKEHKLKDKNGKRFDWVPLEVIQPYAEQDARVTFDIGLLQLDEVAKLSEESVRDGKPDFGKLVERECEFTKVLFEIEKVGMKINAEYIERAIRFEGERAVSATTSFKQGTGQDFVDSAKSIFQAVGPLGILPGKTAKGNPSFTDAVLSGIQHPVAENIRDYRDASKRINTYYKGFLSYADSLGIVHPNIKQTGADTFRLSITDPALQTLNKPDEDGETGNGFEVRDSFVAREGCYLVAIDYKQQEYRLTADYAGEMDLIKAIMGGTDVHTATAALMGVTRKQAKTLNFMLLYGGGVAKLCLALMSPKGTELQLKALTRKFIYRSKFKEEHAELLAALEGISEDIIAHDVPLLEQAHALQLKYFSSLPSTKELMDRVQTAIKEKGYIFNWAGRRLYFPNTRFAYKGPNYLIQSSGSEIMRAALIQIHRFLRPHASKIVLTIHDEILLEMPKDEFHLIPQIRKLMVDVYTPFNGCFMDTDVKIGTSWGSMKSYESTAAV